jgi:hypothetical protein
MGNLIIDARTAEPADRASAVRALREVTGAPPVIAGGGSGPSAAAAGTAVGGGRGLDVQGANSVGPEASAPPMSWLSGRRGVRDPCLL